MANYGMYMVGAQSLPRWLATSLVPSRQCSWCVTHLTVMPSEPLTMFVGSSASSTIPVFVHLKGWRPLYTNPFKVDDTLYLVCAPAEARSRCVAIGVHYRFLGAISESCVDVGDQCSCPHPSWRECTTDKFTKVLLISEPHLHRSCYY